MFKLEPAHIDLVIIQMMRSPALTALAIKNLDGAHLVAQGVGGRLIHAVVFEVIKRYVTQFSKLPDEATVRVESWAYLERYHPDPESQRPMRDELTGLFQLAAAAGSGGEDIARQILQHIAKTQVYDPAARGAIDEATFNGDFPKLRTRLQELEAAQTVTKGGRSITGVLSVDLRDRGQRMHTYIPWIDQRLGRGRGPVAASLMVLIMPQGVGKTSLGMNLCINQALLGRDALLVLAEEGLSASVQRRIKACALGIDSMMFDEMSDAEVFAKCGVNPIAATQKMMMIEKHLQFLDMSGSSEGADEIIAEIASLEAEKRKPVFVYVDWAGFIVNRQVAVTSGKITKESALKTMSYALAEAAVRFNNIICVAQQMGTAAVDKGPTALNDHYCSEDCKSFTQPAKYVIVVNPNYEINQTRVNICNIAKTRDDEKPPRFVLRLKGEMSTFVDVSTDYKIKGKKTIKYEGPVATKKADSGVTVAT